MLKSIKRKIKQAKIDKEIKRDKLKENPQKFPIELSDNEREYLQNTLISAGGGHIWSLVQEVQPFWRCYKHKSILSV